MFRFWKYTLVNRGSQVTANTVKTKKTY